MNTTQIKNKLKKIDDDKLYSVTDVNNFGVILNTKQEPSIFSIYRLINNKVLPTVDMSNGGSKRRPFIKGKDVRALVMKRYNLA
jgi:hypothetical protein